MPYLSIFTPSAKRSGPPTQEFMERMQQLVEESFRSGTIIATGGLSPLAKGGLRVESVDGKISVTDGPFAEAKELVGGFAVMSAPTREDALKAANDFLAVAGDGVCVMYRLDDGPPTE